MTSFLAVLAIVTIAAVTPGPNNFIVMSAAARGGVAAALPAMAGVTGGSIALLILIGSGFGVLFDALPEVQMIVRVAGATYLIWLGFCMIRTASLPATQKETLSLPQSALGVASFQFMNPKSWVLVTTALSAMGSTVYDMLVLAFVFVVVMGLSLTLWTFIGKLIADWLVDLRFKRMFDTAMGLLLMASAVSLYS
ncbi:LysE family translocator [Pseudophaeobacter sp.]|uniref:LysE family translocator n=1 Tax=Pseudophaeobacter sp. TaxID=1971739 RepID=UPI003298D8B5